MLLTEGQYRAICAACDRVLLRPDSNMERVCIPWLHVIREHPVFLSNYVDLFDRKTGKNDVFYTWSQVLRRKAGWFKPFLKLPREKIQPWFGGSDLPTRVDVLFVSHLLNPSHIGNEEDFYFGRLPHEMVARGYSVVIALINQTGINVASFAGKWYKNPVPRTIFSSTLRFSEEEGIHRRLKMESLRLTELAREEKEGFLRRVLLRAAKEALTSGACFSMRMALQIRWLCARLGAKAIIVTHEGHAWERVAFAAARKQNPGIRCIGYQHAALFRLQHAIRRKLSNEYNPDSILTAGSVSKAQLENSVDLDGIPITVLGSNRTFNGSGVKPGNTRKIPDDSRCLVIPEGIPSECHILFEFSLECAHALPDVQFIWRLHPILSYDSLSDQNPRLRNLPVNILLSAETLEIDIVRCRWALYRGTTAIVQGVMGGLMPIYLELPGEMTIDPLYELQDCRESVKSCTDFVEIIKTHHRPFPVVAGNRTAKHYCSEFFKPLDARVLEAALCVRHLPHCR
ncbi:MAG: hypothetical protein C4576_20480 [Desulfobacteraceae bacterium]|nr:MAG: hypothetical protein C4576_20480 [Desulfobacteraceae bacterium]